FATYAEGYRAPAITETLMDGLHPAPAEFELVPNPDLKPEVAHNWEGGLNLKFDGLASPRDSFRAKLVVFRNEVDDYIDMVGLDEDDPDHPCTPGMFGCLPANKYVNVPHATIKGI